MRADAAPAKPPMFALVGFDSSSRNWSPLPSLTVSPSMVTGTYLSVSPAANVTVPLVGWKSCGADALKIGASVPVVYSTVTVLLLPLLNTTGTVSVRVPLLPSIASAPTGYTDGTLGVTALLGTDSTPGTPLNT